MIDMKLNKKKLEMHWHYFRLRYFVFAALALAAANLLLTATKPQTPPELKVDIVLISQAYTADVTDQWAKDILAILPPDQKEVNIMPTPLISGQEGMIMQLIAARMSAREGTIWIVPVDIFTSFAANGAFKPLEGEIESFSLPEDIDLSTGYVTYRQDENAKGETHLYGIPLDQCKGLLPFFFPDGMVLAFPSYADVNYENARIAANWLLIKTEMPQAVETGLPAGTAGATEAPKQ